MHKTHPWTINQIVLEIHERFDQIDKRLTKEGRMKMGKRHIHEDIKIIGVSKRTIQPTFPGLGVPYEVTEWLERCGRCGRVEVRVTDADFFDALAKTMEGDNNTPTTKDEE